MWPLIAHLTGDYVLQNQWMADQKTKRWLPAALHALLYGLPFLLLVESWQAWVVIVATHALIDRYRLARLWVEFWGVGFWPTRIGRAVAKTQGDDPLAAGSQSPPAFLSVWLLIIVDNCWHLTINQLAIEWLR